MQKYKGQQKGSFYFQWTLKSRKYFHTSDIKKSASWKKHLCLVLLSVDLIRKKLGSFWTKTISKMDGKRLQLQYLYT